MLQARDTLSVRVGARGARRGTGATMSRMMRFLTATIAGVLMAAAVPAASQAAGKPTNTCPKGFNLGPVTSAEALELPRSLAGIEAGVVTEERIVAGVNGVDKNGNGKVCVQLSRGLVISQRPNGQFIYNIVDDNSSAR